MELFINIILNNLEIFMIYNLFFRLMKKALKVNGRDIALGLLWGTVNGVFANYVDFSFVKILLYISVYFYIWILCKKKMHEILIITIILILLMILVQLFILIVFKICAQYKILFFQMEDNVIALLGQLLTALCVLVICKCPLPIHKIYEVILKDTLLRILFYITIIVVFVTFNREFILVKMIKYTPIFIIFLFGIYHTVRSISYYKITKYSSVYHDMRNLFFGIFYTTQCSYDIETLKDKLQGYYDVLGFDMKAEMIGAENSAELVDSLIELKLKESDKKIQVRKDIKYYTDNNLVPISSITYMVGVLLDYSIKVTRPEDRLEIYICCSEYKLNIKVSHKYHEEHNNVLKLMNKKRIYNTDKLGHGLSNLKKMVMNYNGNISAFKSCGDVILDINISK